MLRAHQRVYLSAFLMDFSVISLMTVLPFYVFNQLGKGAAVSGAIGGLQSAMYAVVCLVSARYVARAHNGMRWAHVGAAGFVVFACLMPFFRNPWLCAMMAAVSSSFLALYWPAQYSWIGAEPDLERRGRHMALFNVAWSLGFSLGPLAAGPLYDLDYRFPFVAIFVLGASLLALLLTVPHERDYFGKAEGHAAESRQAHDRRSEAYLYLAWASTFASNFVTGVTRTVFPKRVEDLVSSGELRLFAESQPLPFLTVGPATKYSWLACCLSLMLVVMFIWMGRSKFWQHRASFLLGSQVLAAGAFWVLGHTHSLVLMAVCFAAVGANAGISFFSSVYYSVVNPRLKHSRSAINEGLVGAGGFLGSVLFGWLAGRYGIEMPFRWTPLFIGVLLVLQAFLIPRRDHSSGISSPK